MKRSPSFMSLHVCLAGVCAPLPRSLSSRRNREISRAETRNVAASTQMASDSCFTPSGRSAWKSPSQLAMPASAANIAAPSGNVPNAATRPSEFADASWSGSFTMLGTVASLAGPQSSAHTSITNDRMTRPQIVSRNGSTTRSATRARSQVTITTLRFHRSTSAPPERCEHQTGEHARDHHEANRGRRVRHPLRDREDREEPDPVAEARRELRTEQRKEARDAKDAPRRRGNRVVIRRRRNERRLGAHAPLNLVSNDRYADD